MLLAPDPVKGGASGLRESRQVGLAAWQRPGRPGRGLLAAQIAQASDAASKLGLNIKPVTHTVEGRLGPD